MDWIDGVVRNLTQHTPAGRAIAQMQYKSQLFAEQVH